MISEVKINETKISNNVKKIFQLDTSLQDNNFHVLNLRAMIEENRAAVIKNYEAAYVGNRQLVNANRDTILKNRLSVLSSMKVSGDVQINFQTSMINQATLEFMEVQAKLDMSSLEVSELLSKANALLIEANNKIMAMNSELTEFNAKNIALNTTIIEGGLLPEKATVKTNATRIAANNKKLLALEKLVAEQSTEIVKCSEKVHTNREKIENNAKKIDERRKHVLENRVHITKNRRRENILTLVS